MCGFGGDLQKWIYNPDALYRLSVTQILSVQGAALSLASSSHDERVIPRDTMPISNPKRLEV